jgi:hypothetical protein
MDKILSITPSLSEKIVLQMALEKIVATCGYTSQFRKNTCPDNQVGLRCTGKASPLGSGRQPAFGCFFIGTKML